MQKKVKRWFLTKYEMFSQCKICRIFTFKPYVEYKRVVIHGSVNSQLIIDVTLIMDSVFSWT